MTLRILGAVFALHRIVQAQSALTFSGCIDDSGFNQCFSEVTQKTNQCINKECPSLNSCGGPANCFGQDNECVVACGCEAYTGWVNCALSYCWNEVYSCAYQALVMSALVSCPLAQNEQGKFNVPYFPAPSNAPGGCSCNMGAAFTSIWNYNLFSFQSCPSDGYPGQQICACCAVSGIYSSLPDICPEVDPSELPYWGTSGVGTGLLPGFYGCGLALEDYSCTSYVPTPIQAVTPSFYVAASSIPTGSQSISNMPGSLSRPISGNVLTWSLVSGYPATATAASSSQGSGSTSTASQNQGRTSRNAETALWVSISLLVGTVALSCVF